jgi:DNA-binding XRE family transcriptional regulator
MLEHKCYTIWSSAPVFENVSSMKRQEKPQVALGQAIRKLRQDRDLTQEALAQSAGITVGHLSKIERGQSNPTWGTVVAVAVGLGMAPAVLAQAAEK